MKRESYVRINRAASADRIAHDIETLAGPDYTLSSDGISRYAYTDVYRNTLDYFRTGLQRLDFDVYEDPVGTLVGRNRPMGEKVFGVGSHCDSNRNGGKYDGTLGVVTALEICRLNRDLELGLPIQLISFLEEEGSGFGQTLLGSRITAQRVTETDLRERIRSLDDGTTFWNAAVAAGYEPDRWRESKHILDDLVGWIEMHIEQARVLQDSDKRIGIVTAIAGYIHGDIVVLGRADHAGATPMDMRLDAGTVVAESILELERLAQDALRGTVATVGEAEFSPGILNVIPAKARFSVDIRGVDESAYRGVAASIIDFAVQAAYRRGMRADFTERASAHATPMNDTIVGRLERAAKGSGEPYLLMSTGAGHDTMFVADYVPAAMVFVPCTDGISHSPLEEAKPQDAAVAAEIMLNAICDHIATV